MNLNLEMSFFYDIENPKTFNTFFEAMMHVNEKSKTKQQEPQKIKLPKLKKVK